MANNLQRSIDLNITSSLGYEVVPHFDDTDVGLVRHLGEMDVKVTALHFQNIRMKVDSLSDKLQEYFKSHLCSGVHAFPNLCGGYVIIEFREDGSTKVLYSKAS